jgi:hypothetical protein
MANALKTLFTDIAVAIRKKTGEPETVRYKPIDFPTKISSIEVGNDEDIEAIEDALDAINGEVIGETLYTVTFIGADGTQLCQVPVYEDNDCPDPSKDGTIETPTKESTKYIGYRHSGWSMTNGGNADNTVLKKINSNRTVYASFEEYEILLASGRCTNYLGKYIDTYWKVNPDYILTFTGTDSTGEYRDGQQPWFAYKDQITKVVLEEGVRSAGMYSFTNMVSLTEVVLPSDLFSIEQYAFKGCQSLTSITIPSSTKYIYAHAFGQYYAPDDFNANFNSFYLSNVVFEKTSGWKHEDPRNSSDSVSVLASQLQNPADAAAVLREHCARNFTNTGV